MRVIQLSGDVKRGWTLQKFSYVPVSETLLQDSSELGRKRLGEAIMGAINQAGIKNKHIAVGLPASKTFTSIVEIDTLPEKELKKTFKYEIDKYVPMPMADAQADYVVLGPSPNDPNKTEILVSSTAKEYAEEVMGIFEKTGLDLVAMEPEPIAMARALMPLGEQPGAAMIVDFGEKSTDLVITYKGAPRLVRSMPGGFSMLVKTVVNSLNVKDDQARQFILKFGLAQDKVEGQVFRVLDNLLDNFALELAKSIRFFQTKYTGGKVTQIILSGYAEAIPLFAEYMEAKTNVATTRGNPWQVVRMTPQQQQTLMPVSSEFAVAIGLSERSND